MTVREEMKRLRDIALSEGKTDPHSWSYLDEKGKLPSHSGGKKTGGADRQPSQTQGHGRKSHKPGYL